MRWLFLRGSVPKDRPAKEIAWKSLDSCTDMWESLFAGMVGPDDTGTILYFGGHRRVYYRDNLCVKWTHSFKNYRGEEPDVIVARGGFSEYTSLLRKYPRVFKVYYGANHGCIPKDGIEYGLVMVDSKKQEEKVRQHRLKPVRFFKPASPLFFPREVQKKYDVCFVAIHPNDRRKRVGWVHKTCPRDLKVLQLGNGCRAPKNFTVKKCLHNKMPKAMSKCKVGIVPYTDEDSGPRVIPEFLACDVPVVVRESVQWSPDFYVGAEKAKKGDFWATVKSIIESGTTMSKVNLSVDEASAHLRKTIEEAKCQT